MCRGDNQTAIQSQVWFAEALLRLMKEMPYKDIVVRMLCKEADLSRQTFYNLFNDKDEIVLFYLESNYRKYFKAIPSDNTIQIRDFVEAFAKLINDNGDALQMMIDNRLDMLLYRAIQSCITYVAKEHSNGQHTEYGTAFLSGALTEIVICWISDENRISVDELIELIERILAGKYYTLNL